MVPWRLASGGEVVETLNNLRTQLLKTQLNLIYIKKGCNLCDYCIYPLYLLQRRKSVAAVPDKRAIQALLKFCFKLLLQL